MLSQLLPLTQTLRLMLMAWYGYYWTWSAWWIIAHTAMDTDTIVHMATDTMEERRGMLMLSHIAAADPNVEADADAHYRRILSVWLWLWQIWRIWRILW